MFINLLIGYIGLVCILILNPLNNKLLISNKLKKKKDLWVIIDRLITVVKICDHWNTLVIITLIFVIVFL